MTDITLHIVNLRCVVPMAIGVGKVQTQRLYDDADFVHDPIDVNALVDTGAKRSMIDPNLVKRLGLERMGSLRLSNSSSAGHPVPAYDVSAAVIESAKRRWFRSDPSPKRHWLNHDLRVVAAPVSHAGFDVLLGMDLLADRLLVIDGKAGTFTLRI